MKTIKLNVRKGVTAFVLATTLIMSSCTDDFIGKISEKAKVETVVANFPANDGLSIDRQGNVFASNFANFGGTQVVKANPRTGDFEIAVDSLVAPTGNFVDRRGNIFVVNNIRFTAQNDGTTEADVLKVSPDGTRTVVATLPGFPSGITLDRAGNIFVSNFSFPGVHKINTAGEISLFADDARLAGGVGIDFDNRGNLFVGNFATGDIVKILPDGSTELLATIPTVVENVVIGYITYFAGSIFATGVGENVIYRVNMTGEVTPFAGNGAPASVDGSLDEASFLQPNGITADPLRKVVYISELSGQGGLRAIKFK